MKILKPFFHAGALRRPGDEQALADTKPSDQQIESWVDRDLVEVAGVEPKADAEQADAETSVVLQLLADHAEDDETTGETLGRIFAERDNAIDDLNQANVRIGELQIELESLRSEQTPATPNGASVVDINKILEAGELSTIVGAPAALSLLQAGFDTRAKIIEAPDKTLTDLPEVGVKSVEKLRAAFAV